MSYFLIIFASKSTKKLYMKNNLPENVTQSNVLTESRYDFNRLEKNALYCIIREVRRVYVEQPTEQTDYKNLDVYIEESMMKEIGGERHKEEAKAALINLRKRDITMEGEDDSWFNCGFINWAQYIPSAKAYKVEVSSMILPHLVNLAQKYTVYSLTVAISLKSKWAQRFYELCCQYKNNLKNGVPTFFKTIKQLRYMFMLEDSYPLLADFKRRVIDKAKKELKDSYDNNQCDLWFDYDQTGRGENAKFTFVIHTREATKAQEMEFKEKHDLAHTIYKTLATIFPNDSKFCEKCWHHLNFHAEKIEPLYDKLQRIIKNYPKGSDRAKVTRWMLSEDFDMSNNTLKSKKK